MASVQDLQNVANNLNDNISGVADNLNNNIIGVADNLQSQISRNNKYLDSLPETLKPWVEAFVSKYGQMPNTPDMENIYAQVNRFLDETNEYFGIAELPTGIPGKIGSVTENTKESQFPVVVLTNTKDPKGNTVEDTNYDSQSEASPARLNLVNGTMDIFVNMQFKDSNGWMNHGNIKRIVWKPNYAVNVENTKIIDSTGIAGYEGVSGLLILQFEIDNYTAADFTSAREFRFIMTLDTEGNPIFGHNVFTVFWAVEPEPNEPIRFPYTYSLCNYRIDTVFTSNKLFRMQFATANKLRQLQNTVSPYLREQVTVSPKQFIEYLTSETNTKITYKPLPFDMKYVMNVKDIQEQFNTSVYSYPESVVEKVHAMYHVLLSSDGKHQYDFFTGNKSVNIDLNGHLTGYAYPVKDKFIIQNKHPYQNFSGVVLNQTLSSQTPLMFYFMQDNKPKKIIDDLGIGKYPIVNSLWKPGMIYNGFKWIESENGEGTWLIRFPLNSYLPQGEINLMADNYLSVIIDKDGNLKNDNYCWVETIIKDVPYLYNSEMHTFSNFAITKTMTIEQTPTFEKWSLLEQVKLAKLSSKVLYPFGKPATDFLKGEKILIIQGAGPASYYYGIKAQLEAHSAEVFLPSLVNFDALSKGNFTIDDVFKTLLGYVNATGDTFPIPSLDFSTFDPPADKLKTPLDNFTILAHSWGGQMTSYLVNKFGKKERSRIKRIVLLGAALTEGNQSYAEVAFPRSGSFSFYDAASWMGIPVPEEDLSDFLPLLTGNPTYEIKFDTDDKDKPIPWNNYVDKENNNKLSLLLPQLDHSAGFSTTGVNNFIYTTTSIYQTAPRVVIANNEGHLTLLEDLDSFISYYWASVRTAL